MKLIHTQLLETKKIDTVISVSFLVIIVGNNIKNAMSSLKKQIFTNFKVISLNIENSYPTISGEINLSNIATSNIKDEIEKIKYRQEDYVYFMCGEDTLFPNSFLEYGRYLDTNPCDVVYADECIFDAKEGKVLHYEIKPEFEYITAFQSLYSGRAIIFKRTKLCNIIDRAISNNIDTLLREMFLLCIEDKAKIGHIPLILLSKQANIKRNIEAERALLPLMQRNITKFTEWSGKLIRSGSCNPFAYEIVSLDKNLSFEFIIVEEDLQRTKHLLMQLSISYSDNNYILAVWKEHIDELTDWCQYLKLTNLYIKERTINYADSLNMLKDFINCDIQIILNDNVRWVSRMNIERLLSAFNKPEVSLSCPQTATEGEHAELIYVGGEINSLGLNSLYLKGRSQNRTEEYDYAWTNHRTTTLTHFCIALKKEVWSSVFPMHLSICTDWQFAMELSFLRKRKNLICEYSAQSVIWLNEDIGKWYQKKNEQVEIEKNLDVKLSRGYYWHWLNEYQDIIETSSSLMPYAQRSYHRYLKECFHVYGLNNIKNTGRKRALIISHELSFTGAPLVLAQAVESLRKMDYDILVVSPVDGPLRETYLKIQVPVIIEPELFYDFEYVKIVYDFDFVIACTVCLYPVIDVLGKTNIPVLWWIHDSRTGYVNWLRYVLPKTIGKNIHMYCGGDYAQNVILEYRPEFPSKILLYGLEDFSKKIGHTLTREDWNIPADKIAFANIAQILPRKGQDILIAAIEKLSVELLQQSVFIFIGEAVDSQIYEQIISLHNKYPENVLYLKQISHQELKEFYREIDCIICSSTDDPLPAFVAEGLLMSRTVICSRNTAFNGLIENGKNGFLFESGNVEELYQHICHVITNKNILCEIGAHARVLYEENFKKEIFDRNLKEIVNHELEVLN